MWIFYGQRRNESIFGFRYFIRKSQQHHHTLLNFYLLFRKRALTRLNLHAYPENRALNSPQPKHYPVHETRETSRETTRFFRSIFPILRECSQKISPCDPTKPKCLSASRLFVRCRSDICSFLFFINRFIHLW